jgi:serine/threonine-protein kinase
MSMVTLSEGSMFAGRYQIVRCIAAGGMGAVYEVVHIETESHRALKVMLPHLVESDDMRERFRREARVAAQIKSAYIVDVSDAGIDEATKMPFLVMELLQGQEIGKRLRQVGRFGFVETVGYLWQTALALDKTHRANIVHRDLKPANLFLCEDDDGPPRIKVLDFGIAKIVAEGGTQANATQAMGTPLYMAPEQFKSKSKVSPATDIYSLGMIAYTLLVGASYWAEEQATEDNAYAFAGIVMHGPPDPPTVRALRRSVILPEAFNEWFGQATSSNPEQRFFKATTAIKGLASALGVPVPTTSAGYASNATDSQGMAAVTGQTTPGQTGDGQTVQGKTVTPSSASGPQGTMVLADSTAPSASASAEANTHASGYGLSSSEPKVASVPSGSSVPLFDTGTNALAPVQAPKRRKTSPIVPAVVFVACVVGMGVVVVGMQNKRPTADAVTALPLPVPSATMAEPVVPNVVPVEVVKAVESSVPMGEVGTVPMAPRLEAKNVVVPVRPLATAKSAMAAAKASAAPAGKPEATKKVLEVGGRK